MRPEEWTMPRGESAKEFVNPLLPSGGQETGAGEALAQLAAQQASQPATRQMSRMQRLRNRERIMRRKMNREQRRNNQLDAKLFTPWDAAMAQKGGRLVLSTGREAASGDIIPYALMPDIIRKQLPHDAPPIGWDATKLNKRELSRLNYWLAMGEQERAAAQGTEGMVAGVPQPGPVGGVRQ